MTDTKETFDKAFLAFQKECPPLTFNKEVSYGRTKFQYVDLQQIRAVVVPVLNKHGITLSFDHKPLISDKVSFLITTATLYFQGEAVRSATAPMPIDGGVKIDPKDIGGLITFGKRYSAGSVLFLAGEAEDEADLDGGTPIQKAAPDAGRLKRVRGLLAEQFKAEKITPEEGKKQMARAEKMTGDELKNFEIELKKEFFTQGDLPIANDI